MNNFNEMHINIQHIVCDCIKVILQSFSAIVNLYIFYDGPVAIHMTLSQCRVSDTQVTVKARWPLVIAFNRFPYRIRSLTFSPLISMSNF